MSNHKQHCVKSQFVHCSAGDGQMTYMYWVKSPTEDTNSGHQRPTFTAYSNPIEEKSSKIEKDAGLPRGNCTNLANRRKITTSIENVRSFLNCNARQVWLSKPVSAPTDLSKETRFRYNLICH